MIVWIILGGSLSIKKKLIPLLITTIATIIPKDVGPLIWIDEEMLTNNPD